MASAFSFVTGRTVLVVHAHPDDETFATAAATCAAERAGCPVHLRIFTGGEGRSAGLTPAELARARERRTVLLDEATKKLGISDWDYLTAPGRWTDTPHARERAMAAAPFDELVPPVRTAIDSLRPDVVLTVGPDGLTGHPDHIACHQAVIAAAGTATAPPRAVLGAVALEHHVASARAIARRLYGREIGSPALVGRPAEPTFAITAPTGIEAHRRAALDAYAPRLGTIHAAELPTTFPEPGAGVLMRLVLDQAGWNHDTYEAVPIRP